jgi:hypothetical protein
MDMSKWQLCGWLVAGVGGFLPARFRSQSMAAGDRSVRTDAVWLRNRRDPNRWFRLTLLLAGVVVAVCRPTNGFAIVVDWSTLTWPTDVNGNPLMSASFDVDPNNPGNDITVSISGDTAAFVGGGYPTIGTVPITGGTAADSALQLVIKFPSNASNITVSVQFTYAGNGYAYGVDQAQFTLFDIDNSKTGSTVNYADQISSISAQLGAGPPVAATITNIPGSPTYTVANQGTLNATITGNKNNPDTSGNGNATLNFGTNIIDAMSFTYGNGPGVKAHPSQQAIGVFDISYRPRLPETGGALAATAVCVFAAFWQTVRRVCLGRRARA